MKSYKTRTAFLIFTVVLAFGSASARAAAVYSLSAAQSNYTVAVGDTVDVQIFLVEQLGAGDTSELMGPDAGLISAGFRLTYGASDPAQVLLANDIAPNPAFDSGATLMKDAVPGSASLREDVDFGSPPAQGVEASPGVVSLWLGTFRFTALVAGTTVVSVEDFDSDPQFIDFVTASFTDLDPAIQSSRFTINATNPGVVPEPSSLAMAATAALGLVAVARRRRSA